MGTAKSYKDALTWLKKAAVRNQRNGYYGLGLMYENGYGVKRDVNTAIWYFENIKDWEDVNDHLKNLYKERDKK